MTRHYRLVCEHGVTIAQCRCPGLKEQRVSPGPCSDHPSLVPIYSPAYVPAYEPKHAAPEAEATL